MNAEAIIAVGRAWWNRSRIIYHARPRGMEHTVVDEYVGEVVAKDVFSTQRSVFTIRSGDLDGTHH